MLYHVFLAYITTPCRFPKSLTLSTYTSKAYEKEHEKQQNAQIEADKVLAEHLPVELPSKIDKMFDWQVWNNGGYANNRIRNE